MRPTSSTPWGAPDVPPQWFTDDLYFISTASHGGFRLGPAAQAAMREMFPDFRPHTRSWEWLEEDCDWLVLALRFPELFPEWPRERALQFARRIAQTEQELAASGRMRNWTPGNWQHVVDVVEGGAA